MCIIKNIVDMVFSFDQFVRTKYQTVKVSRLLIDSKILLNEFEDVFSALKRSDSGGRVDNQIQQMIVETTTACDALIYKVCSVEASMAKVEEQFEVDMGEKVEVILAQLQKMFHEVVDPANMEAGIRAKEALEAIEDHFSRFESAATDLTNLVTSSAFLRFNSHIDTSILGQVEYNLKLRRSLWELNREVEKTVSELKYVEVRKFDSERVDSFIVSKESKYLFM